MSTTNMRRRTFMSTALARYINDCPDGVLHDDCCFREDAGGGAASCGRECEVFLRQFLPAPFDAGQVALRDGGLPTTRWSTISLVRFCNEHLCRNPMLQPLGGGGLSPHKTQVLVTNCLALLDGRDVDVEALVRGPLGRAVLDGLVVTAATAYADLATGAREVPPLPTFLGSMLLESIGPSPGALGSSPPVHFRHALGEVPGSEFETTLFGWLHTAKLQAIALWWFPGHPMWNSPGSPGGRSPSDARGAWRDLEPASEPPDATVGAWLIDRLTGTYLGDWQTASLHAELRWLQGIDVAPFPDRVMQERMVDPDQLTMEVARRAVGRERSAPRHPVGLDLTEQAVTLLSHGRPELAAALFESAQVTASASEQPDLQMRRGFCLIACAPERARGVLLALADTVDDTALLQYNLAMSAWFAGDRDGARHHAESVLTRPGCDDAYLWTIGADGECLLVLGDAHEYASTLLALLSA